MATKYLRERCMFIHIFFFNSRVSSYTTEITYSKHVTVEYVYYILKYQLIVLIISYFIVVFRSFYENRVISKYFYMDINHNSFKRNFSTKKIIIL